jgi:cystathionine beta-synthase
MVQVDDRECFAMARRLTTEEGLFAGGSSGGAVAGMVKYLADNDHFKCVVTVLPDSGSRYLSKIFSDEWMRDNGFLDEQPSLGTVDDLLAGRDAHVITADAEDKVFKVIESMKANDISQLPVLDNGSVIGVINESDLLNYMVTGSHRLVDPIRQVVVRDIHKVSRSTSLARVSEAFSNGRAMVLVVDNDQIAGVITRIDLIDYIAKNFRE